MPLRFLPPLKGVGFLAKTTVIPPEHAEKIVKKAKELAKADSWWFEQVRKGRKDFVELDKELPLP
ncbi:MAG: hypothetical protein WED04_09405 [Promethearchaeati archaeon SRVP18_Atabeyarchaeia-1]